MEDYYSILGVSRDADKAGLKRAYYNQVKVHSPETDPKGFQELRQAYAFLCDDEKRASYNKVMDLPDEISLIVRTANTMMQNDHYREAISQLSIAWRKYPNSLEIGMLLGDAYLFNTNYNKAIAQYSDVAKAHPESQAAAAALALAYHRRGFDTKAEQSYRAAIEMDKSNADVWIKYLGFIYDSSSFLYTRVVQEADAIDPEMFKNDCDIYGNVAFEYVHSLLGIREDPAEGLRFLKKYARYFMQSVKLEDHAFKQAMSLVAVFSEEKEAAEIILQIYEKLQSSGSQAERYAAELLKLDPRKKKKNNKIEESWAPIETYQREDRKIGRNEPCPCGSGKKYKHCCGKSA